MVCHNPICSANSATTNQESVRLSSDCGYWFEDTNVEIIRDVPSFNANGLIAIIASNGQPTRGWKVSSQFGPTPTFRVRPFIIPVFDNQTVNPLKTSLTPPTVIPLFISISHALVAECINCSMNANWPNDLMLIIGEIASTTPRMPAKPNFRFELTNAAALHNLDILEQHDFKLDAAIKEQTSTPLGYGSEF